MKSKCFLVPKIDPNCNLPPLLHAPVYDAPKLHTFYIHSDFLLFYSVIFYGLFLYFFKEKWLLKTTEQSTQGNPSRRTYFLDMIHLEL